MNKFWLAAGALLIAGTCSAEVFKSQADCVVGKRVADKANKVGVIVRVPKNDTLCFVRLDGGPEDREETYIFWMLRDAGASVETDDKLVSGKYECFAGMPNAYTFMDLIVSGDSYTWAGTRGKFGGGSARLRSAATIHTLTGSQIIRHFRLRSSLMSTTTMGSGLSANRCSGYTCGV